MPLITHRRRTPLPPLALMIIFCFAVFLIAPDRSSGQILPLVTDPITTPELMDYADMLGLSNQQRLSLLSIHDDYKQRYQRFEDGDLRKLEDELLTVAMHFIRDEFNIPPRENLEDLLEQYQRVLTRANSIDRTLFDAMGPVLAEDQLMQLERARTARELKIYGNPVNDLAGEMNGGASVDFSEMLRDFALSADEMELVTPILIEYESSLLLRTRATFKVLMDLATVILDYVEELGLRQMSREEMIQWATNEENLLSLQAKFDEASKPLQTAAYEMSQLNLRTFRRLKPALIAEHYSSLRTQYYQRAFREAYRGPGGWRDRYATALLLEGLSDEQGVDIEAQRADFARREDQLDDRIVGEIESGREYRSFRRLAEMGGDPLEEKKTDYRERRAALAESAETALVAIMGPELFAELDGPGKTSEGLVSEIGEVHTSGGGAGGGGAAGFTIAQEENIDDPFLPPPMTLEHITLLGEHLGLEEDDRLVLETLHEDYLAEFNEVRLSAVEEDDPEATEGEEKPRRRIEEKRGNFDRLAAKDSSFFDDISSLAGVDHQRRIVSAHREIRIRQLQSDLTRQITNNRRGMEEAYIDLADIVCQCNIDAAGSPATAELLNGYTVRLRSLLDERMEAALEVHRKIALAERLREHDEAAYRKMRESLWTSRREAEQKMREVDLKVRAINRDALQSLAGELDDNTIWEVRYGYNRAAYPGIYSDRRSSEKVISAALTEIELTPHQREKIDEIASEYRDGYFRICQRMVELRRKRDFNLMDFQMPSREDIEREIESQRLEFDRDELSERSKLRIRLELTEDQIAEIPGLARR